MRANDQDLPQLDPLNYASGSKVSHVSRGRSVLLIFVLGFMAFFTIRKSQGASNSSLVSFSPLGILMTLAFLTIGVGCVVLAVRARQRTS